MILKRPHLAFIGYLLSPGTWRRASHVSSTPQQFDAATWWLPRVPAFPCPCVPRGPGSERRVVDETFIKLVYFFLKNGHCNRKTLKTLDIDVK